MRPPGITAISVCSSLSSARTLSMRWPQKLSSTSNERSRSAPGLRPQTVLIQSSISSEVINPLACARMCMPRGKFPFSMVFHFSITYGGSFRPSAVTASITVHRCISAPDVLDTPSTLLVHCCVLGHVESKWSLIGVSYCVLFAGPHDEAMKFNHLVFIRGQQSLARRRPPP